MALAPALDLTTLFEILVRGWGPEWGWRGNTYTKKNSLIQACLTLRPMCTLSLHPVPTITYMCLKG